MLQGVLEPEVMDTAEEARDYDSMDHSEVNRRFVADFLEQLGSRKSDPRRWHGHGSDPDRTLPPVVRGRRSWLESTSPTTCSCLRAEVERLDCMSRIQWRKQTPSDSGFGRPLRASSRTALSTTSRAVCLLRPDAPVCAPKGVIRPRPTPSRPTKRLCTSSIHTRPARMTISGRCSQNPSTRR